MSKKEKGERVQKNLRVSEEHAEALEKMAEDLFNSQKKQGQVVEELINLTEYAPNQLKDIVDSEAAESSRVDVVSQQSESPSNHTHTQNSSETSTTSEENQEVSIENMKGRNVDHPDIIHTHIKQDDSKDIWTVDEVTEIVQDEAQYSKYRAKQKSERALKQFTYKLDTERVAEIYKELLLSDYTNLVGHHTSTSGRNGAQKTKELRNMGEVDLFGVERDVVYTDDVDVYVEQKEEWLKQVGKQLKRANQKVLKAKRLIA
ncbi:hypothetical protein EXE51_05315 [Halorubrum sp. CGM5_25_10-8B]|uniref:hypothetical protein n=1 Tax=Halorubrum sp. CGM5_25_10-8B TaxID=2518115 RepID=UPI0010F8419D|nr:hypothetical protein [Halorubrum sp. CGM5_25_10-8B]TKX38010.1 hypothetical protein EXE51_05315 [Halorubrum sp. CGM5_25_10-8B]